MNQLSLFILDRGISSWQSQTKIQIFAYSGAFYCITWYLSAEWGCSVAMEMRTFRDSEYLKSYSLFIEKNSLIACLLPSNHQQKTTENVLSNVFLYTVKYSWLNRQHLK